MKFIGREEQLSKLKRLVKRDNLQTSLIYGRRRVGKSYLVKKLLAETETKSIYYECKQTSEANNVESIAAIISNTFNLPRLGYSKFEDLLDYLFNLAKGQNIIFVLDEYPYLRESIKGLDSILQSLIDKYRDDSQLKLIILGSYVDVMKSLIEEANPLFGRIDLTINLKAMNYYESSMFYQSFSNADKVRLYSVFGGIPYYNNLIDETKTVKENIIDLIASDGARLENEVIMALKNEISKIINANEVFVALAKGYSRFSDILSQSHVSSGPTLVDVLDKLCNMEVVKKIAPINDMHNKRKTGYYIDDNLSYFYYRYIFKYSSQMMIMDAEVFYDKYIAEDFEEKYVPMKFEEIAKEYLIRQNRMAKFEPPLELIGKYYYDDPVKHQNGEFDIVSLDEKGYIFYEVKFRQHALSEKEVLKEIEQVKATNLATYAYVFITRAGIEECHLDNLRHISLDELYL